MAIQTINLNSEVTNFLDEQPISNDERKNNLPARPLTL